MKRSFFLILAAALFAATPALADTSIGVVNIQAIMKDSKAANSVRGQLKEKQKAFQTEFDAKEKAFFAEKETLAKEAKTTDKAAFDAKLKAFSDKTLAAQRDLENRKIQLNKGFAGALDQIQDTVTAIVKELAAEKKLNLVLTANQVLYGDPTLDITPEVLKRLDTKLPNVQVKF